MNYTYKSHVDTSHFRSEGHVVYILLTSPSTDLNTVVTDLEGPLGITPKRGNH